MSKFVLVMTRSEEWMGIREEDITFFSEEIADDLVLTRVNFGVGESEVVLVDPVDFAKAIGAVIPARAG